MDAREYCNELRNSGRVIRVVHHNANGEPDGRGTAIVIDEVEHIAVVVEPFTYPSTGITSGAIVKLSRHPEGEPAIVGSPAYACPTMVGGIAYGTSQ
jgi:hypothetical protein